MPTVIETRSRLTNVFPEPQARVLSEVIVSAYDDLVKTSDFNELKWIVKEIARAQKETQIEVKGLAKAQKETQEELKALSVEVKELAREQKETQEELKALSVEVKELAREQKETQEELKALSVEVKELAVGLNYTRRDLGGLTQTFGYMLENEAYRVLPGILKDKYGIEVKERFLRRSLRSLGVEKEGEVNIFSRGVYKDTGIKIVIIGEAKSQLGRDDVDDILNMAAKLKGIDEDEKFLLAVTHYTKETVVEYAKEKAVAIIQSFEW